eukprot:GHVS01080111.1.p1 GENE.GHVS01080111.1~~GHVS01080111.1.p1  ORF type:complete len:567 (+),score=25.68 GHVS01080111.1:294-1994(+)
MSLLFSGFLVIVLLLASAYSLAEGKASVVFLSPPAMNLAEEDPTIMDILPVKDHNMLLEEREQAMAKSVERWRRRTGGDKIAAVPTLRISGEMTQSDVIFFFEFCEYYLEESLVVYVESDSDNERAYETYLSSRAEALTTTPDIKLWFPLGTQYEVTVDGAKQETTNPFYARVQRNPASMTKVKVRKYNANGKRQFVDVKYAGKDISFFPGPNGKVTLSNDTQPTAVLVEDQMPTWEHHIWVPRGVDFCLHGDVQVTARKVPTRNGRYGSTINLKGKFSDSSWSLFVGIREAHESSVHLQEVRDPNRLLGKSGYPVLVVRGLVAGVLTLGIPRPRKLFILGSSVPYTVYERHDREHRPAVQVLGPRFPQTLLFYPCIELGIMWGVKSETQTPLMVGTEEASLQMGDGRVGVQFPEDTIKSGKGITFPQSKPRKPIAMFYLSKVLLISVNWISGWPTHKQIFATFGVDDTITHVLKCIRMGEGKRKSGTVDGVNATGLIELSYLGFPEGATPFKILEVQTWKEVKKLKNFKTKTLQVDIGNLSGTAKVDVRYYEDDRLVALFAIEAI